MRLSLLAIVFAVASPVYGASTLLFELAWDSPPANFPANYTFVIRDLNLPTGSDLAYIDNVVHGFGTSNFADVFTVSEFNRILNGTNDSRLQVLFYNGGSEPSFTEGPGFNFVWFPIAVQPPFYYAHHVPFLGFNLTGYQLTNIEQRVTEYRQTVYFFGEAIPEPSIAATVVTLLGCSLLVRPKR